MEAFCREIGLPEETIRAVLAIDVDPAFRPDCEKLLHEQSWEAGLSELEQQLGEDPLGLRMLTAQLRCARNTWALYERCGLSRRIYADTMAAFSRFVREHRESFGAYGFDRAFWTVRQISGTLFRIGELEYELVRENGEPVLELHIPSDADLRLPKLRESWEQARALIADRFPDWKTAPIHCHSWLLSLNLPQLLPETSRILAFQRSFALRPSAEAETDMKLWVFKNRDIPTEQLPEQTSLQRSMKAFLLAGGVFRDGEGFLCDDPFLN